jgi:hypothetical protein
MMKRFYTVLGLFATAFTLSGCGWSTSLMGGKETLTGSVTPRVVAVALPDGQSSGRFLSMPAGA